MMGRYAKILGIFALILAMPVAVVAAVANGSKAPDFKLTDIDGKAHALSDLEGKYVVIEFTNPGCPYVQKHTKAGTIAKLAAKYPDVAFLGVNSTNADHKDYLTPEEYKKWVADKHLVHPQLYDTDGAVGQAYGAKTTPHMFVVNPAGEVIYQGAIDNDAGVVFGKDEDEIVNYVDAALTAAKAGKTVDPAQTKPYGCSVKYK
ncbi:MAG: thioredoxin family protein [Deltaproteobacteria bacterium]|nr:thioredoxin family protein [Deltaproteobacteria bacterium]MCB9487495.1 thioredoxin family protein [Deltaproteobacteria bacterium]